VLLNINIGYSKFFTGFEITIGNEMELRRAVGIYGTSRWITVVLKL
jgi:hypothetical protein